MSDSTHFLALVAEHSFLGLIVKFLLNALVLYFASRLIKGVTLEKMGTALLVALVLALLNVTLGALLKFFAFPLRVITFGLFNFVIDAAILWLTARWVRGFSIDSFGRALVLALVVAFFNFILYAIYF